MANFNAQQPAASEEELTRQIAEIVQLLQQRETEQTLQAQVNQPPTLANQVAAPVAPVPVGLLGESEQPTQSTRPGVPTNLIRAPLRGFL